MSTKKVEHEILGTINGYHVWYTIDSNRWYEPVGTFQVFESKPVGKSRMMKWVYVSDNLQSVVDFCEGRIKFDTEGCAVLSQYKAKQLRKVYGLTSEMQDLIHKYVKRHDYPTGDKMMILKMNFNDEFGFKPTDEEIRKVYVKYASLGHH